jgi:2-iminobutanoate/2-iminopropanoate deaminase
MRLRYDKKTAFTPGGATPVIKQAIKSGKLAPPVGPFSPAVRVDGFVYLSGQVGQDPATGKIVAGGVEREAEQIFAGLAAVLEAAGLTFADVVRVGVFLTDMTSYGAVNAVYARFFQEPYPARTTVAVAALPLGAQVEIDLVAKG